ncbi:C40 family peptidase [Streptomyces sp. NPDC001502]|uniref:C40 family peptidase n=1 Tax=Streptomyces sp. NPDC001502 TaxID=3364578 RepID=UPI0036AB08DD
MAGGACLVGFGLILFCAFVAQAFALRQSEAEAEAAAAAARCGTGRPGTDSDTAQIARQVKAMVDGSTDVKVSGLSSPQEQIANAKVIVATGAQKGIPPRGQIIALATALQESTLINLDHGDRDSLGLFQQRPSQGWGTREQIMDPVYASTKFYNGLTSLKNWEQMPLTVAAQKVQKSAFPEAYAKHEPLATALQQAIGPTLGAAPGGVAPAFPGIGGGIVPAGCTSRQTADFGDVPPGTVPDGYQIPATAPPQVQNAIRWALDQVGTMYQWGGSCTNPHGTNPAERCDCSSLTQRAYGVAGVEITRTTYTQVHDGRGVPASAIAPGDLLFFRGTAAVPEHVAMAIGYGYVVHAPGTGKPVKIVKEGDLIRDIGPILAVRRVVG